MAPVHQRVAPARGDPVRRLLGAVAADEAEDLAQMSIIIVVERIVARAENGEDAPSGRMTDGFAAVRLPADAAALLGGEPVVELAGRHIDGGADFGAVGGS